MFIRKNLWRKHAWTVYVQKQQLKIINNQLFSIGHSFEKKNQKRYDFMAIIFKA